MSRKKDYNPNYFGDLPTAYYDAIYKDGQFINAKTGEAIKLKEGARVRLQTLRSKVLDEEYETHLANQKEEIIAAKEQLDFNIGNCHFVVELQEPLVLSKEGNRFSKLSHSDCIVIEMFKRGEPQRQFQQIEATSLNQAYTQTSMKHFPEKRTHNCNAFKAMRWRGATLEHYRIF